MGELDAGIRTFSRIFGLSLNAKKIAIQILGILALVIAWHVIHGIGALILGDRLPWLVEIAGWIAVIFILFFSWGAIARVTVGEVAGLPAVDIGGALRSARKACAALVMAPLKIVAIILILALIHAVVDLVGKIPFLGEIVWPFFAIPLFFLSALMVAAKIILVCGALLLPSIIMAGKQSPVSELNDFLREHALRFIGYLIATLVVVFLVFAFLNMVVAQNDSLSMRVMGDKYTTIATSVDFLKELALYAGDTRRAEGDAPGHGGLRGAGGGRTVHLPYRRIGLGALNAPDLPFDPVPAIRHLVRRGNADLSRTEAGGGPQGLIAPLRCGAAHPERMTPYAYL
ncbi:MAG: hypothetical protein NT045_03150 [Candidatus Aureabacteria bacterium]|nr:hypothetical protein [Candidatus Auribacterota bacterium]